MILFSSRSPSRSITRFLLVWLIVCPNLLVAAQLPARLVPIAKGWAANQINTVIFRRNSVTTFGNRQYVAFYDQAGSVVIARRSLGSTNWEIRKTQFHGDTTDAHRSISIAVDGRGFIHLAWNHHNSPLQYAVSNDKGGLEFSTIPKMIGDKENRVSYPEFYNLQDGDLFFLYRDGSSGNGDLVLNRYNARSQTWQRVQSGLLAGEGLRNAYWQMTIDRYDTIHLSWVWRESPDVASNHDLCYAKSMDGGKTWIRSNGKTYALPITAGTAETIVHIPQRSELINQTSITADSNGRPFIVSYWRDQSSPIPQYRLAWFDGSGWRVSQVSNRKQAFSLSGEGTRRIPISRPIVVTEGNADKARVIVIFRDEERGSRVSAGICDDIRAGIWRTIDLADQSVGMWEPTFDTQLWNLKHELDLFVENVGQGQGETLENVSPQMISILEWKPSETTKQKR